MAQRLMNPTRNHEVVGSIPGLFHGLRIWRCCGLWYRPASSALIQPLALEFPYAASVAAIRQLKKKKNLLLHRTQVFQFGA